MSSLNVSVVIPAHNRASHVGRAIKSVREQSGDMTIELIVIDDGSEDDLASAVVSADPTARLLRHDTRRGAAAARNTGIAAASSRYVAFLDSDDTWLETALVSLMRVLASGRAPGALAVAGFTTASQADSGRHRSGAPYFRAEDAFAKLLRLRHGVTVTSCMLLDRDLRPDLLFDEKLAVFEDYDLCLRTANQGLLRGSEVVVARKLLLAQRLYSGAAIPESRVALMRKHRDWLCQDFLARSRYVGALQREVRHLTSADGARYTAEATTGWPEDWTPKAKRAAAERLFRLSGTPHLQLRQRLADVRSTA